MCTHGHLHVHTHLPTPTHPHTQERQRKKETQRERETESLWDWHPKSPRVEATAECPHTIKILFCSKQFTLVGNLSWGSSCSAPLTSVETFSQRALTAGGVEQSSLSKQLSCPAPKVSILSAQHFSEHRTRMAGVTVLLETEAPGSCQPRTCMSLGPGPQDISFPAAVLTINPRGTQCSSHMCAIKTKPNLL